MIIEFMGVSGVGKSTLTGQYYSESNIHGKDMVWPRYDLYEKHRWLSRNLIKSFSVALYTICHPAFFFKLYKILGTAKFKSYKNYASILFNCIYFKSMLSKCNNNKCDYIFDEGVFQLIWGVYLRSNSIPEEKFVTEILALFGTPDKLVVIDADNDVIKKRLIVRGTKTKILESDNLIKKIAEMKTVLCSIIDIALQSNLMKLNQIEYYNNNKERTVYADKF